MATYKVIQDIEAEDHILGPLSLRQFIYALVAAFCLYMCFIGLTKHILPLLGVFLPVALLCGFFAFPFGKDQPTEVWALAKIRFLFMPRKRIWDQSGIKELVTITAPKKLEKIYTDGLSQNEVRSRLQALADTIDSRGWAIKNVNVNLYGQPALVGTGSDRLIDLSAIPQAVPEVDITPSEDMLDEQNNPVAQQFSQMIGASAQAHRRQIINKLNGTPAPGPRQPEPAADYWFLNQAVPPQDLPAGAAVFDSSQLVTPGTDDTAAPAIADVTPEEAALLARVKKQEASQSVSYDHLRTIQPLGTAPLKGTKSKNQGTGGGQQQSSVKRPDPVIQQLAGNDDLDVATLARQAKKAKDGNDGEVTISLR
jgi:hypothetical protein